MSFSICWLLPDFTVIYLYVALNDLWCANVPLRNHTHPSPTHSLTHSKNSPGFCVCGNCIEDWCNDEVFAVASISCRDRKFTVDLNDMMILERMVNRSGILKPIDFPLIKSHALPRIHEPEKVPIFGITPITMWHLCLYPLENK